MRSRGPPEQPGARASGRLQARLEAERASARTGRAARAADRRAASNAQPRKAGGAGYPRGGWFRGVAGGLARQRKDRRPRRGRIHPSA